MPTRMACRAVAAGGRLAGTAAHLLYCSACTPVCAVHPARSAGSALQPDGHAYWARVAIVFRLHRHHQLPVQRRRQCAAPDFSRHVSPELGTYIIAAFVILTTALAGMSSVAYMDVAIGSLVTVHLRLIAAPALLGKAGGWAGVHAALPASHFQRTRGSVGWCVRSSSWCRPCC